MPSRASESDRKSRFLGCTNPERCAAFCSPVSFAEQSLQLAYLETTCPPEGGMTRTATIYCSTDYADKRDQIARIDETVKLMPRDQPAKSHHGQREHNVRVSTTLHRKNSGARV
jgi:hypothetical protein